MEKKLFVMAAAIMMATASANAQEEQVVDAYFTADEMPDMRLFMPGPPDSTSVAFANDVNRYFWGKEMREDQERADQAKRDAVYGLATIRRIHLRSIRCCSKVPPPATVSVSILRLAMVAHAPSSAFMSIP